MRVKNTESLLNEETTDAIKTIEGLANASK